MIHDAWCSCQCIRGRDAGTSRWRVTGNPLTTTSTSTTDNNSERESRDGRPHSHIISMQTSWSCCYWMNEAAFVQLKEIINRLLICATRVKHVFCPIMRSVKTWSSMRAALLQTPNYHTRVTKCLIAQSLHLSQVCRAFSKGGIFSPGKIPCEESTFPWAETRRMRCVCGDCVQMCPWFD
jgi:hypothetical protein